MRTLIALLIVVGASFGGGLTSDFVPHHGTSSPGIRGLIKWKERLLTARSTDGLTFKRDNNVITDQARSPNLLVAGDKLYLYYVTAAENERDALAVAISADSGESWVFKYVEVKDGKQVRRPYAPDVRVLTDGRFRLSFDENPYGPTNASYDANSDDGVHFTVAGTVNSRTRGYGSSSLTVPIGEVWHTYLRGVNADYFGVVGHGISNDGETFEFASDRFSATVEFSATAHLSCYPTSAISLDKDRVRFYCSSKKDGDVFSLITRDGAKFQAESGVRLTLDPTNGLEKDVVRDATVVKLPNGTYFMVYVAGIP